MAIQFDHRIAAHCETGTVSGILRHYGLDISEPMSFGIGGGIFFGYFSSKRFSFHKIVSRSQPGKILSNVVKRLGVKGYSTTFRNPEKSTAALDALLNEGKPATLQVDMFHMDYMPQHMRIHFNAHFINVFGREGEVYHVSDAYVPNPSVIPGKHLEAARFVRGDLAPKGFMFHPVSVPRDPPMAKAIKAGIRSACFNMLKIPIVPFGVRGIRKFADMIVRWPEIAGSEDRLAHETIMIGVTLEDMGTGGAGFRFMYATFLSEAAALLGNGELGRISEQMRENGDRWREISLLAARTGKERDFGKGRLTELSDLIRRRADAEETIFRSLLKAV